MRLIDLVQVAVLDNPHLVIAIDNMARAFVAENRRRDLKQRLRLLDAKELAAVEALIDQFEQSQRGEDSSGGPGDEPA